MKDTFFSLSRFMNLCRKEMVESWKANVLRIILLYGVMAVVMVWNGYFEYKHVHNDQQDPMWIFLLITFVWSLWGFGCLSASFTMEKMKSKTSRISVLMTPATSFEKFFSRWLIFTVVFLVVFLITYKLADYTRVLIYSLAYPENETIAPVNLSHLAGYSEHYNLCDDTWEFGGLMAGYFFFQSCFVLGSTIWPKNAFLKTFAVGTIIAIVYMIVGGSLGNALFESGRYTPWKGDILSSKECRYSMLICVCALLSLMNWTLAYFRFKESEIINRM